MDQKYQSALNKILKLAADNKEFGDALRNALGVTATTPKEVAAISVSSEARINKIESYLGLDYAVDSQKAIVDYSFVDDQLAYQQLVSDNREMMRYRYGTRYHKTDFPEFCRYVLLQAEMLLNYFYGYGSAPLTEIEKRIKTFNPYATFDNAKSLSAISFNVKLWAYRNEFKLGNGVFGNLDKVRTIRNEQSHRSPKFDSFSVKEYQDFLTQLGLPLKTDGEVNWPAVQKNEVLKNLYSEKVDKTDNYKTYCFLLWCERQSFDEVTKAIKGLAKSVHKNLNLTQCQE